MWWLTRRSKRLWSGRCICVGVYGCWVYLEDDKRRFCDIGGRGLITYLPREIGIEARMTIYTELYLPTLLPMYMSMSRQQTIQTIKKGVLGWGRRVMLLQVSYNLSMTKWSNSIILTLTSTLHHKLPINYLCLLYQSILSSQFGLELCQGMSGTNKDEKTFIPPIHSIFPWTTKQDRTGQDKPTS